MKPPRTRRPGFTLVELLLVLVIMGVMAAVVALNLMASLGGSRVSTSARALSQSP